MGRPRKKAVGLGDTVESILAATHVDKMAKWLLGDDCGCDERKAKLNELFPYRKPECLEEPEYNFLKEWFERNTDVVKPSEQATMLKIHSRIFKVRNEPTSCVPCLLDKVNQLRTVYNEYLPKDEL
jgi:hypothetical protein